MARRTSNQQPLKDVIDDWLNGHPMARRAKETQIVHLWGDLLGLMVKNHTSSVSFRNGRLTVTLDSAAIRHELSFARTQIVESLNKELGSEMVTELVLN
ncbi:MAG: DUF721 domain-containing protein [Flavobacteriales bacterium]|nr:DUF721 domain-containing protein [Flavobacteriales bacterium]